MKIRNGYVSNSSSSSFIIAYKEGATAKVKGFELSVDRFLRSFNSFYTNCGDSTEIIAEGEEGIINEIKDWWGDDKQKYIDAIKNNSDKNIVYFQISYGDELLKDLMKFLYENKAFEYIYNEDND